MAFLLVHNSYLQIWVELGLIGLIVSLVFSGVYGRTPWCLVWTLWRTPLAGRRPDGRYRRCMVDNLFSYTMIKPQVALYCGSMRAFDRT